MRGDRRGTAKDRRGVWLCFGALDAVMRTCGHTQGEKKAMITDTLRAKTRPSIYTESLLGSHAYKAVDMDSVYGRDAEVR